jgi:hypothetical protein
MGAGPRNTNTQSRYAFPEANPYTRLREPPTLQFGEYGELTMRTIQQAGLSGEERRRAIEMMKIQAAYLEIYNALDFPNDPDGHLVDLSAVHMTQPKVAIAWTLACLGFRRTAKAYIKKRHYSAPGIYANAYYYVDVRAPDDAAEELTPQMYAGDHHLPPDTRRLAAIRDGSPGQELPQWAVRPKITWEDVPRGDPPTSPPADTMDAP